MRVAHFHRSIGVPAELGAVVVNSRIAARTRLVRPSRIERGGHLRLLSSISDHIASGV
jgi:hypothetical protein